MKKIKKGNLNYDQSGRAYPDNPRLKENWDCIWKYGDKYYELVGDNQHKEWDEVNIYNQIIDEVYKNYVSTHEDFEWTDDFCKKNLKDYGDQWDIFSKEEFINKCKTDSEFSERRGLKIEERELNLEERVRLIMDTPEYRNYTEEQWKVYINTTSAPTKQITLEYNGTKTEVYEQSR